MNRTRKLRILRLLVCALFALPLAAEVASRAGGDPAPGKASGRFAPVAWMAGHWTSPSEEGYLEEFWTAPFDDAMVGVFRWHKGGKLWMTEHLLIIAEGDGLVLRLKHFNPDLVEWEDKDKPMVLKMIRQASNEATFETPNGDKMVRLTFRKTGDDSAVHVLEHLKDGQWAASEFNYRRAD